MPVSPIDYGKYGHPDMVEIFDEKNRHKLWLEVEAIVADEQAKMKIIPQDAAKDIARIAKPSVVTLERTREIERRIKHDTAALVEAMSEQCEGPGSRWVHFGLTSNDIIDSTLAIQLRDAFDILLPQLDKLCEVLATKADTTRNLVAVGRSHGQHGVPITYGLRFAVWLDELLRHKTRLQTARDRAIIGKLSGTTGSHAVLGPQGIELQEKVMTRLGIKTPIATTQIIQRDRHAESVMVLANLAASLDKFATDLRTLQRTEIGETAEPFEEGKQVGSSTMPHKRNPVICEEISGIARLVRSLVLPALENVISWEERDISHSPTEKFLLPQAFILVDHMVREMTRVVNGLVIYKDAVAKNLNLSKDTILSEYVLTLLTKAGLERPKAHKKIRELSAIARSEGRGLIQVVQDDMELAYFLGDTEINAEQYYGSIRKVSRDIVEKAIAAYKASLKQAD